MGNAPSIGLFFDYNFDYFFLPRVQIKHYTGNCRKGLTPSPSRDAHSFPIAFV